MQSDAASVCQPPRPRKRCARVGNQPRGPTTNKLFPPPARRKAPTNGVLVLRRLPGFGTRRSPGGCAGIGPGGQRLHGRPAGRRGTESESGPRKKEWCAEEERNGRRHFAIAERGRVRQGAEAARFGPEGDRDASEGRRRTSPRRGDALRLWPRSRPYRRRRSGRPASARGCCPVRRRFLEVAPATPQLACRRVHLSNGHSTFPGLSAGRMDRRSPWQAGERRREADR